MCVCFGAISSPHFSPVLRLCVQCSCSLAYNGAFLAVHVIRLARVCFNYEWWWYRSVALCAHSGRSFKNDPSPALHTYVHHTHSDRRTLLRMSSPHTYNHVDVRKLIKHILSPAGNSLLFIRTECQWHETKANELEWRLKRSALSAAINLRMAKWPY